MAQPKTRDEIIKEDVRDLHRLGYAQELFRTMGGFSNFAISFSIISILTGAVILYDYGLAWSGTAASLIGWPVVTIFVLMIAASMAEVASAYPTAGGLYYWSSRMKGASWGWWTAWLNLIGQFAIVAGINFAAAFFLNETIVTPLLARAGMDYHNATVLFAAGGTAVLTGQLLTMGLLMVVQLVMNVRGINLVALLNQVSVWWHIVIVAAVVILLFAVGKADQSGLNLFAIQPQDQAGSWNNNLGFVNLQYGPAIGYPILAVFFFSLLQANWTYTGYDASAHVAEETVAARKSSAWGIFLSVAVSAVVGFLFLFALTTHLPNLSTLFPATLAGRQHRLQPVLLRQPGRRHRHPQLQPGPGGRNPGRRHRHRHGLLRPVVDRLGRSHAVRLQPRRRFARLGLAEARLAPPSHPGQRHGRDRRGGLALQRRGRRRWRRHGHRHRDGHLHDLPVRGLRHPDPSGLDHRRLAQGAGLEPGSLVQADRRRRAGLDRGADGPLHVPHLGQHLLAVHGGVLWRSCWSTTWSGPAATSPARRCTRSRPR